MALVSRLEQWLLELTNMARLDPLSMAQAFGIDLNQGLPPGTISATAKQPLAMSDILAATTDFHGDWILQNNSFGTFGYLDSSPGDRMAYAGFNGGEPFDWAENIGWRDYALNASLFEDSIAASIWRDLFIAPETRQALLAENFNEVGFSYIVGQIADFDRKAALMTQDFGDSDTVFITGGAYASWTFEMNWTFMPVGVSGVTMKTPDDIMVTDETGGYRLAAEAGRTSVRLGSAHVAVTVEDENIKLDLIGDSGLRSSHSVSVYSGVTYAKLIGTADAVLVAGDNAGTIRLEGNSGDNRLSGNRHDNVLDGGLGDDFMQGGDGDDFYIVDSSGDKVNEFEGGGFDRIETTASFKLSLNSEVEVIHVRDEILWDAIDLSGNRYAQELRGNYGNNRLDGVGGGDVMIGLKGDDVYIVRDARDRVVEAVGGGRDVVKAGVSYTLAADAEIERLETRLPSSAHTIALTGNDFVQTITGNAGNNTLSGMGGDDSLIGAAGNDVLIGGLGADALHGGSGRDRFVFRSAQESAFGGARDSIYGWESNELIDLSAIDADPDAVGHQGLVFAGQGAYGVDPGAGQVTWYQRGSSTYVIADTNGDGQADFEVRLSGLHGLVADDFLLV